MLPRGPETAGVGVERAVTWSSQPCTLPPIVKWPWTKAKQEAASNLWPGAWGCEACDRLFPFPGMAEAHRQAHLPGDKLSCP